MLPGHDAPAAARARPSGERRAQAAHPAKKKPELLAAGPDEVWSWDITKLKGPARDLVPAVCHPRHLLAQGHSLRDLADRDRHPGEEFIEHAIAVNGGIKPRAVHADRGTSMTSDTVAGLYAKLNIAQSHSRPRVSDDNPYSEAQFKTLKYCPAFPGVRHPGRQRFCGVFFTYYNTEHRHSGIACTPPLRPRRHLPLPPARTLPPTCAPLPAPPPPPPSPPPLPPPPPRASHTFCYVR